MDSKFIRSIQIDWNKIDQYSYLRNIPALADLEILKFNKHITFFVGENGTGKSTLLEAIAVAYGFNPEGGTMNFRFNTYNDVSELRTAIRISKGFKRPQGSYFFRAESFFNVASKSEEYDEDNPYGHSYGGRGLHEQSHGESFLAFFQSFHSEGLYIMDEPEAEILSFDDGEIHPCGYEDTESYQVMEMFINNREILMERLLRE